MMEKEILLIRHPEAEKNVNDQHGGKGTSLTLEGKSQCAAIATYVRRKFSLDKESLILGHNIPQVKETATILQDILKIELMLKEELQGIDLGILAGLSRNEAATMYPNVAERLERWRQGKCKIHELNLPGAEKIDDFKDRIEAVLNFCIKAPKKLILIICTRSTLIMLANLIKLGDSFHYDSYEVFDFKNGSITHIQVLEKEVKIVCFNDTNHLNGTKR